MPHNNSLNYQVNLDLAQRTRWSTLSFIALFLIVIGLSQYPYDYPHIVLSVGIFLLVGAIGRIYLSLNFEEIYRKNAVTWEVLFGISIVWLAATWGVFCMLSVIYYELEWVAMLVILATAGLCAGAVTTISIRLHLIVVQIGLMLLPTTVATFIFDTHKSYAIALMFLMYIVFLLMVAKRLNAEYWKALNNAKLLDDRAKELERSNKELESYSYSIAHDLRAPLRSIVSFSQILQAEGNHKLNNDEMDCLNRVINASKYMAELIDDILELSRITRGNLRTTSVNLSNLADSFAHQLSEHEPHHQVKWKIEPGLTTTGDARLLDVAIQNLIGNSWKFTHCDGKKHEIQFGAEKKQDQVVYYVKDNGVGFDMKYSEKLFNAFERLHNNSDYGGNGIGLATVARVVNRHGGKVWADAMPGEGATFYFTLDEKSGHYPH